jgi:pimeloyl-CoA synthetase
VGKDNIFKSTIGYESLHQDSNDSGLRIINLVTSKSLHQDSNDNGVRIMNLATSKKNLVVKSTMFPHRNIHMYTCTSPDGKTQNQTDHILTDRRWHSRILDVRSSRGAEY